MYFTRSFRQRHGGQEDSLTLSKSAVEHFFLNTIAPSIVLAGSCFSYAVVKVCMELTLATVSYSRTDKLFSSTNVVLMTFTQLKWCLNKSCNTLNL